MCVTALFVSHKLVCVVGCTTIDMADAGSCGVEFDYKG
jgi:hypothetical protein